MQQLMLSAFHCVNDLEDDIVLWYAQFRYQFAECGGTQTEESSWVLTGAIPLTNSADVGDEIFQTFCSAERGCHPVRLGPVFRGLECHRQQS